MITLMCMQISLIDNDFSGNFKGGGIIPIVTTL